MPERSTAGAIRDRDPAIAAAILALAAERGLQKTLCPSEVARRLIGDDGDWRALMPEVRRVAGQLAADGRLRVLQAGQPVDIETARGPIRLQCV